MSIGLPVYNGENYLVESLDALLSQTYRDFELIISDNASTDRTEEICRQYAAADPRIRYLRQPRNIGGSPNQDFVFRQARGELFKWAAHDDLYGPELVERCVEALDRHPEAVLSHAGMAIVDGDGELVTPYDYTMATDSPSAPTRFKSLLVTEGGDDEYGVIRADVLRKVRPCDSFHNPGRPFVAGWRCTGRSSRCPRSCTSVATTPRGDRASTVQERCARMDPRRAGQSAARLYAEYLLGYVEAIRRAPLSTTDRLRCLGHLVGWLAGRSRRLVGR